MFAQKETVHTSVWSTRNQLLFFDFSPDFNFLGIVESRFVFLVKWVPSEQGYQAGLPTALVPNDNDFAPKLHPAIINNEQQV